MHNDGMGREFRNPVRNALTAAVRSVRDRVQRWRGRPPEQSGVREPRRPRPTLPAGSLALDEPRIAMYRRWMKPKGGRDTDR
jgi:hypothetical protein